MMAGCGICSHTMAMYKHLGGDGQHRGPDDVGGGDAWMGDQRAQTGN